MYTARVELAGQKFGRLTVLEYVRGSMWRCKCSCGKEVIVKSNRIRSGHTKSCGCLKRNIKMTHGQTYSTEYKVWEGMLTRCNNSNYDAYKHYGGRDIKVCKRWDKFENFYEDMGSRPEGTTLDRINNDKGYSKKNCRWATQSEQHSNKRSNVWLTYQVETKLAVVWSGELGIPNNTISNRLKRGLSVEEVLSTSRLVKKVKYKSF